MSSAQIDELDTRLQQLVIQAQKLVSGSNARRAALKSLFEEINRQSYRLVRPNSRKYPPGLCAEIFDVAYQRLLLFVYHRDSNVEGYKSEVGTVITWLNVKLDRRFFQEAYKEIMGKTPIAWGIDGGDDDRKSNDIPDEKKPPLTSELIKQCIEEDREGLFETKHIRHRPDANFKAIALKRLSGESWKEIAASFGITSPSTVSNFHDNSLAQFAPMLERYLRQ
jgi:hypothetical protein